MIYTQVLTAVFLGCKNLYSHGRHILTPCYILFAPLQSRLTETAATKNEILWVKSPRELEWGKLDVIRGKCSRS